jgi:hypothetical protein
VTDRNRSRVLLATWLVLLAGGLAAQGLLIANHATWSQPTDPVGVGTVFAITYGLAGALVLHRRPGNPVARLFLFVTAAAVLAQLTGEYAILAYNAHTDLPLRGAAAWVSGWTFFLMFPIGATLIFLFFPDGLDKSRWQRVALGTAIVGAALLVTAYLATPGPIEPSDRVGGLALPVNNVTGFLGADLANTLASMGWAVSGLSLIAAVVFAVIRLRRSSGERRQQLRWFAYFASPVAPAFLIHGVILSTGLPIVDFGFPVYYLVYLVGIPVAVGIALLRHRLYELDVVISRTLVYGSLAVFITVVYVGIAVGIGALVGGGGKPNLGLSILATAIVAVGFQPVRERVQRVANRLVYGKRATPYEVLSQFSERVAKSYAVDEVMPRMARVLAEGTGAQRADVWVRSGGTWQEAAVWPEGAPTDRAVVMSNGNPPPSTGTGRMVEVRHQGDLLGALSVTKRAGEQLTPVEESLLTDLTGQAGLVLRNVGLTSDLEARIGSSAPHGSVWSAPRTRSAAVSSAISMTVPSNTWWRSRSTSGSPRCCWAGTPTRPSSPWPSSRVMPTRRSKHCATWPVASIHRCSRTGGCWWRSSHMRARRRSRSPSRPSTSSAIPRTWKRRSTSAASRPCRTSRSTPAQHTQSSGCAVKRSNSALRSRMMAPDLTPPPPRGALASPT